MVSPWHGGGQCRQDGIAVRTLVDVVLLLLATAARGLLLVLGASRHGVLDEVHCDDCW